MTWFLTGFLTSFMLMGKLLNFFNPGFFIYKMRLMVASVSQDCCKDWIHLQCFAKWLTCQWSEVKVTWLCLTLCDSADSNVTPRTPGSSVRGILQARILAVGSYSLLQGILPTQEGTQVSCIAGGFFIVWATREARLICNCLLNVSSNYDNINR